MKRFFFLLAIALFLGSGVDVQAASCEYGPYKGECRPSGCNADEMDAGELALGKEYAFTPCAGTCCIPKGNSLCSLLAVEAGSLVKTKPPAGSVWACSPSGSCGTPLSESAGIVAATTACAGANVCCTVKADAKKDSATSTKGGTGSPVTLVNPLGPGATLFTVIQRIITAFLGVVGALALAAFVYAGILWMTAGSSDRIKTAQDTMKNAVIGLLLIAFSYAITTFFLNALTGGIAAQQAEKPTGPAPATPPEPNP